MAGLLDPISEAAKALIIGDCLAPNTKVMTYRGASKAKVKDIEWLYLQFHNQAGGKGAKNWNPNVPTYLLWAEDGHTGRGKVLDIVASGVKRLWRVSCQNGDRCVEASEDHLFLTIDGWTPLRDLSLNSQLLIWDRSILEGRRKQETRKNPQPITYSIPYHPYAMQNVVGGIDYKRIATSRLVVEAEMNGISLGEFIRILRKEPNIAATLDYIPSFKDVHHLDGDPSNNDSSNLVVLNPEDHNKTHANDLINSSRRLTPSKVFKITDTEFESRTYDIMMDDPCHNFLANGIAVHNSGHGKTGSKAALIAAGYKLRMIDSDNGFKIIRSLLTDDRYPYAKYMKKHGVDPTEPGRISYIPIENKMGTNEVTVRKKGGSVTYDVIAPVTSSAWSRMAHQLKEWKDGDQNFGSINDWDNDVVLDFDTISTLAEIAQAYVQDLNNRLGALEDEHGRDAGDAQKLIGRLSTQVTSSAVRCNVIWTSHIVRVDTDRGAALSPGQLLRDQKPVDARGFPSVIGRALSPLLGKRWNDLFIVGRTGNGRNAERLIYSVPHENTDAKHSAWVEPSYSLATGLAEIFAALRYNPTLPNGDDISNFVREIGGKPATDQNQTQSKNGFGSAGGFGSRN